MPIAAISEVVLADTQPPHPSFDDLSVVLTFPTKSNAASLFWSLDGPLSEAISVMEDSQSPGSLTPYSMNGTLHPISQESICTPKRSSVRIKIDQLENWEWRYVHEQLEDAGQPPPRRWHGTLDNYDTDEDSNEEDNLLGCCGEQRLKKERGHACG